MHNAYYYVFQILKTSVIPTKATVWGKACRIHYVKNSDT
jgi:hypothetical protein